LSERAPQSLGLPPRDDVQDLFDNAPCGYLITDPDGLITRVNGTAARWLERSAEGVLGMRLRDLLTIPGRVIYETNLAPRLRLQGGVEEIALDMLTGTGRKLPCLINALARRSADGELLSVRIALIRAGERRGYERDLQGREAVALRSLDRERADSELREQFIAVLGHDLRNPLAGILGGARLLRREVQSDKAVRVLDLIETSVERMAGLIDNVMDFARGRLGDGIGLQREAAVLEPVLRQVADELEADQPSRTILREFALPGPINCDAGRIAQLTSNLLGNALTYGDPRQPVRLYASATEETFELWVANAGPPIPEAARARLFQPFFRGEVRPSQQGLGLGLHIASEIAKAHSGALTVRSDNVETRFTFTMPLNQARDV
jgi:sigma-B regulation protein RsbU (phosphoserine phosphatase)